MFEVIILLWFIDWHRLYYFLSYAWNSIPLTIHLVPVHNTRRTYGLRLLPQLPCPNALIIEIANFSSFILFSIPNILNYRPTMATVATNENLHMNYDWHKWSKMSMRELLIVIAFLFRLSNICCWTLFSFLFFYRLLSLLCCLAHLTVCWWCRYVFIGWINNENGICCVDDKLVIARSLFLLIL